MPQPNGNDHVFTDDDVWEYLKIAFDLESAADAVLVALQEGQSIAEAERTGSTRTAQTISRIPDRMHRKSLSKDLRRPLAR